MPGLVAVGLIDTTTFARHALARYFKALPKAVARLYRHAFPKMLVVDDGEFVRSFFRFVIAHELGHLLQFEMAANLMPMQAEAGADPFAGYISGLLGWDRRIGAIVAHSLGCQGSYCDHPDPNVRASTYVHGHNIASSSWRCTTAVQ
jgi:hypothetical protein